MFHKEGFKIIINIFSMFRHCLIGGVSNRTFLDTKISTILSVVILVLVLQFSEILKE